MNEQSRVAAHVLSKKVSKDSSKKTENSKKGKSGIKSQSSDKVQKQKNIDLQYDSYMKDYANLAAVTKKLME